MPAHIDNLAQIPDPDLGYPVVVYDPPRPSNVPGIFNRESFPGLFSYWGWVRHLFTHAKARWVNMNINCYCPRSCACQKISCYTRYISFFPYIPDRNSRYENITAKSFDEGS